MASELLDPLALRFPRRQPGCACAVCTRLGWSDSARALREDVPSVFAQYKLVRQQPGVLPTPPPPPPSSSPPNAPPPPPKRVPLYDYDMTDADYDAFSASHPSSTLYAIPPSSPEQPWVKAALKTVRAMCKLKAAAPFLHPVDPVALSLPDYPTIIRHPMDLGTIEAKLTAHPVQYTEPGEWESDMRLVFANAYLYNKPEHFVSIAAKECSVRFETALMAL